MADDQLEDELRALGRMLDLPPSPDPARMAAKVSVRLAERPAAAGRHRLRYAAALVIAATALLVAGSPQVRAAIAEFFRFGGVVVEHGTGTSTGSGYPGSPASAPATAVAGVAAAQSLVPFPVRVPAELGPPEEVAVIDGRVVSFTYRANGIRLDQLGGWLDPAFAKLLPAEAPLQRTMVDGGTAIWIEGPHELIYVDRNGQRHTESARLAANTLIWQYGEVTLRLEGAFTIDRAVAIAQSMR